MTNSFCEVPHFKFWKAAALRRGGSSLLRWMALALVVFGPLWGAEVVEPSYRLGPGDRITVSLGDLKELEIRPATVDLDGTVEVQHAGKLRATGLSCAELAQEIRRKLTAIIREPEVKVEVSEYGSQPVSILGSVNKPGAHQLRGPKRLIEVLAMAEGMKPEAGNVIKITRRKVAGELPLTGATVDASGEFIAGEIGVKALLEAARPELNIPILAHDVISVPRADLVYVLGNVRKPGGFALAERESVTVLQAISMSEGIDAMGSASKARIIRPAGAGAPATEVAVNVKKMLEGKLPDQAMRPNDILFIPNSKAKSAGMRVLEAGIQMGTGIAIFRR
jgi:polysaccharide biosynthesis/export protein